MQLFIIFADLVKQMVGFRSLKKTINHIGILFLAMAGVIIMAHAMVPHHLHNGQAFIETSECNYQHHETSNPSPVCNHNHSESEETDCVLHHLLVLPGKQIRAEQPIISSTLLNNFCDLFNHDFLSPELNKNASEWLYHIEGTIPLPTSIYTSTKGLRAPPLV